MGPLQIGAVAGGAELFGDGDGERAPPGGVGVKPGRGSVHDGRQAAGGHDASHRPGQRHQQRFGLGASPDLPGALDDLIGQPVEVVAVMRAEAPDVLTEPCQRHAQVAVGDHRPDVEQEVAVGAAPG